MDNSDIKSLNPLYFEMIINQFPEAAEFLGNIVRYCRYRQHENGVGFDIDDYSRFIKDKNLKQIVQATVTQAFELHELQSSIRDYTQTAVDLATDNPEVLNNGTVDVSAVESKSKDALTTYEDAYKVFVNNMSQYQQWLEDNKSLFLEQEEVLAQAMQQTLQEKFNPQEAIDWVNKHHASATPEEKKQHAKAYAKKEQTKRNKLATIYKKPQEERRRFLAEYYREEEEL